MISFLLSIVALFVGYFVYGRFVESLIGPDDRPTPARRLADGIDFVELPTWKVFMIQFLNIAGTGPIFGAILGAKFGPSAYLWIVFGCIFAGAVHDYFSGMLSMRHDGSSMPELIGIYLGKKARTALLMFGILVLLMVGAVFVYSPAIILGHMSGGETSVVMIWVFIIFAYYIIATLMPIDKIIGKVYPLFAFALLFMAAALMVVLFIKWPTLPEVWEIGRVAPLSTEPVIPCLFITIACGAISGFHATQSPMMARCLKNERLGRPTFYGAMITEGVVALIWATVSSWFFYDGGYAELQSTNTLSPPQVVTVVSQNWLGIAGGILAILGVVAAPITSGDTALRSARLIVADFLHLDQHPIRNRLWVAIPLFAITALLLWFNVTNQDGFNVIWNYFAWSNQTLSCFMLWTATVYLVQHKKAYIVALVPALFMTTTCVCFILISKIGLGLSPLIAYSISGGVLLLSLCWFITWKRKFNTDTL